MREWPLPEAEAGRHPAAPAAPTMGPESDSASRFPWRYALVLTLLAVLASVMMLPYTIALISNSPAARTPTPVALAYGVAIEGTFSVLMIAIGLRTGRSLGLTWPPLAGWDAGWGSPRMRRALFLSAAVGAAAGLAAWGLGEIAPLPELPEFRNPPWHVALLGSFGAGIREEIWLRLGLMTVFAATFTWLSGNWGLSAGAAWSANLLAALLFGAFHLPQAAMLMPLTLPIVAFVLLGNGVVGLACGWLYWREGLIAAMVAHTSTDLVIKVLLPLIGS